MRSRYFNHTAYLVSIGLAACSSPDSTCLEDGSTGCDLAEFDVSLPLGERLQGLERDLGLGSRGGDVRAVHEYLTTFGYFPNEDLRERYRDWQPMVADSPVLSDVFDEQSALGVAAFQEFFGLSATGIVDEPTRALMRQPRCGVPEGIADADPSEKYDIDPNNRWDRSSLELITEVFWRIVNVNGLPFTTAQVETATRAAATRWNDALRSLLLLPGISGKITIQGAELGAGVGGDATLPDTGGNDRGGRIRINGDDSISWTPATLETVMTHEMGHAIGLSHSRFAGTVMYEGGDLFNGGSALSADDSVAASVLYDAADCGGLGRNARDIAVGGDGADDTDTAPELWIVSTTPAASGGFKVYHWESAGLTWEEAPGQGAVRIAVASSGRPLIVNDAGAVFRYNKSEGGIAGATWTQDLNAPCANDIGSGGLSSNAWVTACDSTIWRASGATWTKETNGRGRWISVDRNGVPWIVASDLTIWRRVSSGCPSGGTCWTEAPGGGRAVDIGLGPDNIPWVLGQVPVSNGFDLFVGNFQGAGFSGTPPAVERNRWIQVPAAGTAIAASPAGRPWWARADGRICFWGTAGEEVNVGSRP